MRFLEDGADIPDDLIRTVAAGEAVFLCGAGVSLRAGMPTFEGLTEDVYAILGETFANEAPERDAFGAREYDRALRALEKRTHRPGDPVSRVRAAVAARLAPVPGALLDHRALIELSKDSSGRTRLLTTNFETLFERAAVGEAQPSHAGKALPKPGGPRDFGVLHLHGRIADPELNLEATDLVLTSADFGDAYLRDGWASQYVEDRMRLGVLVLVGYRAEDAAFRLLMETLDADRDRFRDLKDIYAIERAEPDSAAAWRAKGIKPIEFSEYDQIYSTLSEWASFAARPLDYARDRLREILSRTPPDTNEFEREQARFLLGFVDLGPVLVDLNPSLAWMPTLAEWKLVGFDERRLVAWIDRNSADPQAVRHVVANIGMFGPEAGDFLEYRLRQQPTLPPLLLRCWRLVARHMRSNKRGLVHMEWFDVRPRIAAGERTAEVLERLAAVLRPALSVQGRDAWGQDDGTKPAERPSDLFAIKYSVGRDIRHADVLVAWTTSAPGEADARLLAYLTSALDGTLADAVDVGVEGDGAWSLSDSDVPSVAGHEQNAHHYGFLDITRVIAEVWTRLAQTDAPRAINYVRQWAASGYRLNRRIALFACADPAVPANVAADILIGLPQAELFLSGSAVEVVRLIQTRWIDFDRPATERIESRLREGPPRDWFREGAEIDRAIDRYRFDILGHMERVGFNLTDASKTTLNEIRTRWPQWVQRPEEQAGFSSWFSSSWGENGDPGKLEGVSDAELVARAREIDAAAEFREGHSWQALCQSDPDRALRGLEAAAASGSWDKEAWRSLLWSPGKFSEPQVAMRIAGALLAWPDEGFDEDVGSNASFWLNESHRGLADAELWRLWDRIATVCSRDERDDDREDKDLMTAALNAPAGRLAEVLLRRLRKIEGGEELAPDVRVRLDRLVRMQGRFGKLTRIRFAAEVSLLFDFAPAWTTENVLPLFEWSSPEAPAAWAARHYSGYIGAPGLFGPTKEAFLALFGRPDVSQELVRRYAQWLAAIAIANQSENLGYPISGAEIRTALRRAGPGALASVAHHLAAAMGESPTEERARRWREVVGPVFQSIWPLDVELQTESATFGLVQLLRGTGEAFPEAVDAVLPFLRPEREDHSTTVYSLAEEADDLFAAAPAKMLDLLTAIVGDPRPASVFSLRKALAKIQTAQPALAETRRFQKLIGYARPD